MAGLEFWWCHGCSYADLENLHLCLVVIYVALSVPRAPQVPDGMKERVRSVPRCLSPAQRLQTQLYLQLYLSVKKRVPINQFNQSANTRALTRLRDHRQVPTVTIYCSAKVDLCVWESGSGRETSLRRRCSPGGAKSCGLLGEVPNTPAREAPTLPGSLRGEN